MPPISQPTIFYLGNDPIIHKNLAEWLKEAGLVFHFKIQQDSLFCQEEMDTADMILLDWDALGNVVPQELIDFPSPPFLEPIPLLLLASNPPDQLPQSLWQNQCIEVMAKPLAKQFICKWVQQALKHHHHLFELAQTQHTLAEYRHQMESATQSLLTAQKEKDTLLREIHHRVKNNLQIVSSILTLHSSNESDPRIEEMLKNTQSRVDTISLIHKKLYESPNFAAIDMKDYVKQQISNTFHHFSSQTQQIRLDFHSDPVQLDIDRAIHCALLINELVVNAIRHAFLNSKGGQVKVRLARWRSNQLQLLIADNGQGLPRHINPLQAQSIGLRLVHHLIAQLEGTLDLAREHGTSYQITFALD